MESGLRRLTGELVVCSLWHDVECLEMILPLMHHSSLSYEMFKRVVQALGIAATLMQKGRDVLGTRRMMSLLAPAFDVRLRAPGERGGFLHSLNTLMCRIIEESSDKDATVAALIDGGVFAACVAALDCASADPEMSADDVAVEASLATMDIVLSHDVRVPPAVARLAMPALARALCVFDTDSGPARAAANADGTAEAAGPAGPAHAGSPNRFLLCHLMSCVNAVYRGDASTADWPLLRSSGVMSAVLSLGRRGVGLSHAATLLRQAASHGGRVLRQVFDDDTYAWLAAVTAAPPRPDLAGALGDLLGVLSSLAAEDDAARRRFLSHDLLGEPLRALTARVRQKPSYETLLDAVTAADAVRSLLLGWDTKEPAAASMLLDANATDLLKAFLAAPGASNLRRRAYATVAETLQELLQYRFLT
jgi:hypothetical protein